MLDQNIKRRHLTIGQKAMFAQAMYEHEQKLAKERQKEALARGNDTKHQKESSIVATLPQSSPAPKSRDVVAKRVGVGQKAVLGITDAMLWVGVQ